MEKKNWNVIIQLTSSNIPIHFNKLIRPACSVDSVDLLIFKKTLLEVIELVAFCWNLFFSRTHKIKNKRLFNFGKYECFANVFSKNSLWSSFYLVLATGGRKVREQKNERTTILVILLYLIINKVHYLWTLGGSRGFIWYY